jgi:hypothetical protein
VPLEMREGNYSNVGHRGPVYKGLGTMNPCDNLHANRSQMVINSAFNGLNLLRVEIKEIVNMLIGRNHAAVWILLPDVVHHSTPPPSYVMSPVIPFAVSSRVVTCEAHSFLANRFTPLLLSHMSSEVRLLPVLTGCDVECVVTSPPLSAPNFR